MAITSSVGYEGTVNEAEWADLISRAGGRQYGVAGAGDWKVTAGTGDRQVRVAAGKGFGYGIVDDNTAQATLPALGTVGSGSRWDLIVAHRDWSANATTFAAIPGSATRALPTRDHSPGTVDDQPIALVRVQAGLSQVAEIIDLRVWGGDGGVRANDILALSYVDRIGTEIQVGLSRWRRTLNELGSPTWALVSSPVVQQRAGVAIAGISVAANGSSGAPIIKTGQITDSGSSAFGNQYVAGVAFTTPFPNALLSVQVTQIQQDGALATPIALDEANANGFRAFYPSASPIKRSFLWMAVGY